MYYVYEWLQAFLKNIKLEVTVEASNTAWTVRQPTYFPTYSGAATPPPFKTMISGAPPLRALCMRMQAKSGPIHSFKK